MRRELYRTTKPDLFFLPAELLFLEADTLRSKLLGKNRRITTGKL
jgi:hypothetical protein